MRKYPQRITKMTLFMMIVNVINNKNRKTALTFWSDWLLKPFMHNLMKTIAWDVDDVLNDLMLTCGFKQKWIKEHKDCKVRYPEVAENPPHRLLGVGINEYLSSLDEYRLSALYQQMTPIKEIMEWFARGGNNFRHIALTAVPWLLHPPRRNGFLNTLAHG